MSKDSKVLPSGTSAIDFKYQGRPAKDQDDFGPDVGIADMACVNQFGEANNNKYYHAGVVTNNGAWYVYLEWGRAREGGAKSWDPTFQGQDFQFKPFGSEGEARKFFASQCRSKNLARIEKRIIAGVEIWAAREGKDGYLVQDLATRTRGLPDAYSIKDSSGVKVKVAAPAIIPTLKPNAHPKVVDLASSLVGGVKTFTRSMAMAAGVTPTMSSISKVREQYIPAALARIGGVGQDIEAQIRDPDLQAISKAVAALVPRPIPRKGQSETEAILSSHNILVLQQDLDTFESSLHNEDFSAESVSHTDPDSLLNAKLEWLDPLGEGRPLVEMFLAQTNNRHGYLSSPMRVNNLFRVNRPDRDALFMSHVKRVGDLRKGVFALRAGLQPRSRPDLTPVEAEAYRQANVILTQHGTRSVNVSPILQTHFRLPQQLRGVPIAGANFGHGTYTATDRLKAVGYTSYDRAAWSGGGGISGRGAFMFMTETLMGDAYLAPSTGSWTSPPNGKDSVFGRGGDRGHSLQNDEHVVFEPHYNRIRYLVEFTY